MFQLTAEEFADLMSQIATSSSKEDSQLMLRTATSSWGGTRKRPYAFTEHGAIMAATVLNSKDAVKASLFVVRAFVQLREMLSTHRELGAKLDELERQLQNHDEQIVTLFDAIRQLMEDPGEGGEDGAKPPIGFQTEIGGRNEKAGARRRLTKKATRTSERS